MDRNNSYFYLSGFMAITLFSFFISIALFMMLNADKIKSFALEKDNYISVSINMSMKQAKKTINNLPKPITQETKTTPIKENVNIDNLFSDVWTKSIKYKKPVVKKSNKRNLQEISKKIKKSEIKKTESVSDIFENIDTNNIANKDSKKSTALEVNEYLAKIQALVYKHFFPPQNSEGNSVQAVIHLSAIGKVIDFRILNYSSSKSLNEECDKVKNRLIRVVFPRNPDNISGRYTITLTSQE